MTVLQLYNHISPFDSDLLDVDEEPDAAYIHLRQEYEAAEASKRRELVERQLLSLGRVVKELTASSEVIAQHLADTRLRGDSIAKRIESVKAWMFSLMTELDIEKLKDPLVTVYTQANPASVEILDEALVPVQFQRATWSGLPSRLPPELREEAHLEVMKQAILAAIKEDGEVVPGVEIVTDKRHLRVR